MNSDFFLVRRAKKGDPQAVDILVRKYYDTILLYLSFKGSAYGGRFGTGNVPDVF